MNRQIKFRAWDVRHNCMYLPDIFDEKIVIQIGGVIGLFNGSTYDTISRDRFKLEQFTGLHDKNGTEIYEGDILRHVRYTASIGVMEWSNYLAAWTKFHPLDQFEVIGNIHENPDLLK